MKDPVKIMNSIMQSQQQNAKSSQILSKIKPPLEIETSDLIPEKNTKPANLVIPSVPYFDYQKSVSRSPELPKKSEGVQTTITETKELTSRMI